MRNWLLGFLWKDVKLFSADRQAVVMSFVVPVLIASILGWLDMTSANGGHAPKVAVLFVDQDQSAVSKSLASKLDADPELAVRPASRQAAEREVGEGSVSVAVVVPKGFGSQAAAALMGGTKAQVSILSDPSKPVEGQVLDAKVLQDASSAAAQTTLGALAGSGTAPLELKQEHPGKTPADWSRAAHDYAGFGLQGLLFFAIEAAVGLSRERRQGMWKRLGAAPVPSWMFVFSRGVSSTILALAIILLIFAIGAILFGIRITGSIAGFAMISLSTAVMCSMFGLLFATIGRSESQNRGIAILVILIMLATGGAWFPLERMPSWVQSGATYLPVRWSVEGFDAVTWRGLGIGEAAKASAALIAFATGFGVIAVFRFRRDRETA